MTPTPRIIEFVGPAGAGKSTLARTLAQRETGVTAMYQPCWRELGELPFFLSNALALSPTFFRMWRGRHGIRPQGEEIATMVILEGWPGVLRKTAGRGERVVVLDQGPISMLATLMTCGSGILLEPWAADWWRRMYKEWAGCLEMAIWLDAPNETLMPRIRGRGQPHEIKRVPDTVACTSLDEWREIYRRIFSALCAEREDFKIYRIDTGNVSPHEVYCEASAVLGLNHHERGNVDNQTHRQL